MTLTGRVLASDEVYWYLVDKQPLMDNFFNTFSGSSAGTRAEFVRSAPPPAFHTEPLFSVDIMWKAATTDPVGFFKREGQPNYTGWHVATELDRDLNSWHLGQCFSSVLGHQWDHLAMQQWQGVKWTVTDVEGLLATPDPPMQQITTLIATVTLHMSAWL